MNVFNLFELLDKLKSKYSIIDTHCLDALKPYQDPLKTSKETRYTVYIMSPFILLVSILIFIIMLPIRLYADIKYTFIDVIKKIDEE